VEGFLRSEADFSQTFCLLNRFDFFPLNSRSFFPLLEHLVKAFQTAGRLFSDEERPRQTYLKVLPISDRYSVKTAAMTSKAIPT